MGCGAVQNPQAQQPFSKTNQNNKNSKLSRNDNANNSQEKYKNGFSNRNLEKQPNISQKQTMNHAYQVKQLLGKGTYGSVFRCVKNDTGQQFALKVVKLSAKNKQQAKRHVNSLKSEISVLKKLNHPNIVKYYSFDISPDNEIVQIVFELVQSGTLKDHLQKNGPLSQSQASKICRQILQGLDYLHEKSIIHRDLKCANILMDNNGVVKITDFGTAKQIKVKTNQDIAKLCASLKGTPYYMAPQILKRSGHHKSADIWSFGCTLIQMLTGKPPWAALTDNFQEIISYIISGIHPPLPKNLTKQCQFFLESCFDAVPSQRLTARQLLNHRFILMNTKNITPSLAYESISPKNENKSTTSNKTKKKVDDIQVTDLHSIKITEKKRSSREQITQNDSQFHNAFKKSNKTDSKRANNSNMFLDSAKFNQHSEPFLNYYGSTKSKQIQVSEPYIPMKKQNIKSAKKNTNNGLKKVAKTAGHMKMTEQNLLDWNHIEEQMLSNQQSSHYQGSSQYTASIGNTYVLQNSQISRSNTEQTEVDHAINTALAKEQRQKYLQNQKRMKKQKQEQRRKWQDELKKESINSRREISHRFITNLT